MLLLGVVVCNASNAPAACRLQGQIQWSEHTDHKLPSGVMVCAIFNPSSIQAPQITATNPRHGVVTPNCWLWRVIRVIWLVGFQLRLFCLVSCNKLAKQFRLLCWDLHFAVTVICYDGVKPNMDDPVCTHHSRSNVSLTRAAALPSPTAHPVSAME